MNKPVILLGAGGHAKCLINCLLLSGVTIFGLLDYDTSQAGKELLGIPVLGNDDLLHCYPPENVELVDAVGTIGKSSRRRVIYESMKAQGYSFRSVFHPSAVIAQNVQMADGIQIMAGAVIQPGCRIGCNSIINTRVSIDHDCIIGNHVHIAPGSILSGGVSIGDMAHIGPGAVVIQGIKIGAGSLVAAGAVVTKDVGVNEVVMGIPARTVRK